SIIAPHAPESPPIGPDAMVACIGSCFAVEMSKSLIAQGKPVASMFLHERWNTPFSVRHFLEAGLDETPLPAGFGTSDVSISGDAIAQLGKSTAYIITLGQSVCWFESKSGKMVFDIRGGGTNVGKLTEALQTHAMRQTSAAENLSEIEAVINCIRRTCPQAPI